MLLRETVFSLPREGIYFRVPTMFCSVELQSDLQVDRRIWMICGNNDFAYTQGFCCLSILVDNLNMKSGRQGHFRLSKTKQNTFLLKIFNEFVQLLLKLYSLGFHIERRANTVGGKKSSSSFRRNPTEPAVLVVLANCRNHFRRLECSRQFTNWNCSVTVGCRTSS